MNARERHEDADLREAGYVPMEEVDRLASDADLHKIMCGLCEDHLDVVRRSKRCGADRPHLCGWLAHFKTPAKKRAGGRGDPVSSERRSKTVTPRFQARGSESRTPPDQRITFDSAGLGFSFREGRVFVHYPKREATGATVYGGGFQIDYPFRFPDANDITRERVGIVTTLSVREAKE